MLDGKSIREATYPMNIWEIKSKKCGKVVTRAENWGVFAIKITVGMQEEPRFEQQKPQ